MARQKQYEPATLASTLAWDHYVNVRCLDCHRSVDLDMAALIDRYGRDLPIPVLGERLVCSKCGKRGVYIVANNADTGIPGGGRF
jgi:hypothetical protein